MPLLRFLEPGEDFPPTAEALAEPNGLLAAGGCLDTPTLLRAYARGIFPWFEDEQPILWWSPDPRSVLFPAELRVSKSLRKRLRQNFLGLSANRSFETVMRECAAPRPDQRGTWIDESMIDAYAELHRAGHAQSIEVWLGERLVGGLYGVGLGGVFFGESMFSRETDASKVALVALAAALQRQGATMIDCQVESAHLNSLGARNIPRVDFEKRVAQTQGRRFGTLEVPASCGGLA
jgi:leucyl/phenylalanyl-tRNA--protein transferase